MKLLRKIVPLALKIWVLEFKGRRIARERLHCAAPVLVLQMGKVGSSSVRRSLLNYYPGLALHAHAFSADHPNPEVRQVYHHCITKANPIKIVSLTREPVSRNISCFFQNFKRDVGMPFLENKHSIDELQDIFMRNYNHSIPLEWFDNHFLPALGIDVYSEPFPECGHARLHRQQIDALLLHSELDDTVKSRLIGDFVNCKAFQLNNSNTALEKPYARMYEEFRQTIRFPEEYLDRMYHSRYFRHFYGEKDVPKLKARWLLR